MTDQQARNMILAAEELGFEREPGLHRRWYDATLHDDARAAFAWVIARRPELTPEIFGRPEPISAEEAVERIADSGRFSVADEEAVIAAAMDRGFTPPAGDLPLLPRMEQWDQAQAAVAFLWEKDPTLLGLTIGDAALLAPTPDSAWRERSPY